MTTLKLLCEGWLSSLPAWGECAPRGRGLTAHLVTEHLLYPDLVSRWASVPPLTATLTDEHRQHAEALLRWSARRVERQIRLLREGIDEGMAQATTRNLEVSISTLAHKLAGAIGKLEASGEPLSAAELAAVVSTYLSNRPPRGRKLSRDEFVAHEPRFLRLWERVGAAHLAAFPPSLHGLGDDERPPIVGEGRESTWDGLGRSVHSRFAIAARDARVEGSAQQVAGAEIRRACGRLGLRGDSCLVALRSLSAGFSFGPGDGDGWRPPDDLRIDDSWKSDPSPLGPTEPVSGDEKRPRGRCVHADMAAFAQACVAAFLSREAQGRYLRLSGYMDLAYRHAMRRAWMMCFQHDRRGEAIDGRAGATIVSRSIFNGIPTGEAHRRSRRPLIVQEARSRAEGPATATAADEAGLAASLAWLAADRERALGVLRGDADPLADYQRDSVTHGLLPLETLLGFYAKDDPA